MHFLLVLLCTLTWSGKYTCDVAKPKCALKFDLNVCYSTKYEHNDGKEDSECQDTAICKKHFNITYVKVEPYSAEIVSDLIRTCCGRCTKANKALTINSVSQITSSLMNVSHFVFPILGRSDAVKLYEHKFIPLIETPSIYYITAKVDDSVHQLIISCLNMWPLLIICLLMVVISGFVGWLMESRCNHDEFPSSFLTGWFEGFWWSFISMTTVGYGDKIPKSVPARLFSVAWIFIGITTFSMVTAMLSAEITKANSMPPPTISGHKIGTLGNRLNDAIVIARHGGILVDTNETDVTVGIHDLIKMMRKKDIDGFILDRYTLIVLSRYLLTSEHIDDIEYLQRKTIQTEIPDSGERLYYGMLVRDTEDYEYLVDFVEDNRNVINACNGLMINSGIIDVKAEGVVNPLFSAAGKFFWQAFLGMVAIIILICCFGVIYESRRKSLQAPKNSPML